MAISPVDHYGLFESVPTTIGEVRAFMNEVEAAASRLDADVYWRGQTNHSWGVTSSLSRLSDTPTVLTDRDLREAESSLIEEAARWVTSLATSPANELEWLALLQHMGVPTRLIDFTPDPLIATFFASEAHDDVEGRLFAILVPKANAPLEDASDFRVNDLTQGEIRLWTPPVALSPRVAAQKGVFVLGRLPSTAPRRRVRDPESVGSQRHMLRSEVVSVMSVPLAITGIDDPTLPYQKGVRCYTARIHVDKAALREQLAKRANRETFVPLATPSTMLSAIPTWRACFDTRGC